MKLATTLATVVTTACLLASGAHGDGLPVVGADLGPTGIARPGGQFRYVTVPVRRDTLLAAIGRKSDAVERRRLLAGRWTIPVVAYDGSVAGLSADGQTLVLVKPRVRFPRRSSAFAIVPATTLRARPFTLRGDFSFDAISPDGRLVYLIEYVDRRDFTRYAVRLYDVEEGRLQPEAIFDPGGSKGPMRGSPLARAEGADGRWAYTLYDGAGGTPFVHALDTVGRTARCIFFPGLSSATGGDLSGLRLDVRGSTLVVSNRGTPVVLATTHTFVVREPSTREAAANVNEESRPWWIAIVAAGGLVAACGTSVARRRSSRARP